MQDRSLDFKTKANMTPNYKLNNGVKVPKVALGTWQSDPGQVRAAVKQALHVGYKHIDCAFVYGNEAEVGEGMKAAFAAGVNREDIFITSKLWNTYHRNPEKCLDEGLRRLGLDYVDLYLMHWPVPMSKPPLINASYVCLYCQIQMEMIHSSLNLQTDREILTKNGRIGERGRRWRICSRPAKSERLECPITASNI